MRASHDAGGQELVLASAQTSSVTQISLAQDSLYWMLSTQQLLVVPRDGSGSRELESLDAPYSVYPAGEHLYYSRGIGTAESHGLYRLPIVGGAPVLVDQGEVTGLATDGDAVFWGRGNSLWTVNDRYGAIAKLATIETLNALLVDKDYVYWATLESPKLWRAQRSGGAPMQVATSIGSSPVSDGFHVYFISSGAISRVPAGGGDVEQLHQDDMAAGLALDDTHLYWANKLVPPTVKRLPKPPMR